MNAIDKEKTEHTAEMLNNIQQHIIMSFTTKLSKRNNAWLCVHVLNLKNMEWNGLIKNNFLKMGEQRDTIITVKTFVVWTNESTPQRTQNKYCTIQNQELTALTLVNILERENNNNKKTKFCFRRKKR